MVSVFRRDSGGEQRGWSYYTTGSVWVEGRYYKGGRILIEEH